LIRHIAGAACLAAAAVSAHAQPATRQLHVCHAGSLQAAFADVENAFTAQHPDVLIDDVSGGSVTLARRLATGMQACDVYASADYADIDLMLKPAGVAEYTVTFARGRMVLAYLASDPNAQGIAGAGDFHPPAEIPMASANWYQKLLAPGVRIAGAHPFLDPGGYRAHMMLDLTERYYKMPGLYNALLEHYMTPAAGALGKDFSFQFIYEHSAAAAAQRNPTYRYVRLPDRIDLSVLANNASYAQASVTMPGLGSFGAAASVTIPATRTAWGLTIPRTSAHVDDAIAFVNLLLGPTGTAALKANGPTPLVPAAVSRADFARVPKTLKGVAIE
jgi:ABC-type molybdate transport system substrate-binding protein